MTFLTPMLAGIAAAIAVPSLLILYFLKLRRRDVEISSTLLWKKAIQDFQANAPFQRLRRNILLLLQLIILALALLALAQPHIPGTPPTGQRHVILIDRSASMSATDAGADGAAKSRLEKAKEEAIQLVDSLESGSVLSTKRADEAMVLAFGAAAEVRQAFTSDKSALRAAINSIEPTDTPSLLKEAAVLVQAQAPRQVYVDQRPEGDTLHERPPGRVGTIHIWSDGKIADAQDAVFGPEDTVLYYPVGMPDAANVGITSLRAVRDYSDPRKLSIFVGVTSSVRVDRSVDVELLIDGTVARIETVAIPPGRVETRTDPAKPEAPPTEVWRPGTSGVVFRLDRADGGMVSVRLIHPTGVARDVLPVDDTAWIVIPPAKQMRVAVVTRGDLFINEALAILPLASVENLTPDAFQSKLASREGIGEYDVVILDGWLPEMPKDSTAFLPPGRFLVFGQVLGDHSGMIDRGTTEAPSVAVDWLRDHPALRPRGFSLDNLYIFKPRNVELRPGGASRALANSETGPIIIETADAESLAITVPFDPSDSNWQWERSWVIFLGAAIQYLGEAGASGLGRLVKPGEVLADRLPIGSEDVRMALPRSREATIQPSPDGRIVYGPIVRTGVYTVSWRGQAGAGDDVRDGRVARAFAANLLDPVESDIPTRPALLTATHVVGATDEAAMAKADRPLWPWLLLAGIVFLLLEWYVYNRRVHL